MKITPATMVDCEVDGCTNSITLRGSYLHGQFVNGRDLLIDRVTQSDAGSVLQYGDGRPAAYFCTEHTEREADGEQHVFVVTEYLPITKTTLVLGAYLDGDEARAAAQAAATRHRRGYGLVVTELVGDRVERKVCPRGYLDRKTWATRTGPIDGGAIEWVSV